ncbi:MAG: HD domain-containing protein [Bacteroidales bacterium]|nr:HD domain-containing protein [Bacteroidales bacterium]
MDGVKRKTSFLKHIAELISQNKTLVTENEKLIRQNEQLLQEIEKYKQQLDKSNISKKQINTDRIPKILKYKVSTVLYAEAQGFSEIQDDMDTNALVDNLDEIFLQLNTVIAKYEIKNLKTIGDTIMCVGGIPKKNITNPLEVVLAAVEMQYYIMDIQRSYSDSKIWKLRIGIHTGPLVATVTGRKKLNYEVKGDTVNLAARIRSFCEDGKIIISATTYEIVKDLFNCEYFGKLPVKYKGDIQLYMVKGIKPDFSLQHKGLIPNKQYSIRFGLIQFMDLQELILDKLEKELPKSLYYHNVKHTVDVVTQVELIGLGEGVSDEELLILKTAALFHDTGHTIGYDNHEYNSTLIAREILPDYYYTQSQIEQICNLIMATKLPPNPKDKLEEIICDADLDYLGRSDMIPVSNTLFMELKEQDKIGDINEWNKLQIKFISGHQYFTYTARNLREVNKQMQIDRIASLIDE